MSLLARRLAVLSTHHDPDVVRWAADVRANGGVISNLELRALSVLVRADKVGGGWPKRDDLWIFTLSDPVASRISLKQRLVAVNHGAVHIPNVGYQTDGSSTYMDLLFTPSVHGSVMTGSSMHISVREHINVAGSGAAAGAIASATSDCFINPRVGGGQIGGRLNSSDVLVGSFGDSRIWNTVWRNGSDFGAYRAGTDQGTASPTSTGTTPCNFPLWLGGRNNGGALQSPRGNVYRALSVGGYITAAEDAAMNAALEAFFLRLPVPDVYVSDVSYGGIPIGNDANVGTSSAPYLTWDAAYAAAGTGARILLNGNPASPSTYQSATSTNIAKAVTVRAIEPLGAILAGVDTTRSVLTSPVGGETINFQQLLFDATENTGGTALRCLELTATARRYTVNIVDCTFQGFTGASGTGSAGIFSNDPTLRATVSLTNTDIVGDTCRSGLEITTLIEGGVSIEGGTITLTSQNEASAGAAYVAAKALGVTCQYVGVTASVALDTGTLTGSGRHYGLYIENIAGALIDDCDVAMTGKIDQRRGAAIFITTNQAGDVTELPMDGSIIRGSTASVDCNGGGLFVLGSDGAGDKTKAVDVLIEDCVGTGTPDAVAEGLHGVEMGTTTNGICRRVSLDTVAIGWVDKLSENGVWEDGSLTNVSSTYMLSKGSIGATFRGHTITATSGYAGQGVYYEDDTPGSGAHSTDGICENNFFINAGAASWVPVQVDADNTATFSGNDYHHTSGSEAANPWTYQGTGYATLPAWEAAHEPDATGNM